MEISWSALDGILGAALVAIVIWAAFKLVKRVMLALLAIIVLAAAFFGLHFGDFGFGG